MQSRVPRIVSLPPGAGAVALLADALRAPDGPIAPIPDASNVVSPTLRAALLAAVDVTNPLPDDDTAVVLSTSGSTGEPKGVRHSLHALHVATSALHERLGGAGDWVCALPLHSSAGFMTVARAVFTGTQSFGCTSLGGAEPFTPAVFMAASEQARNHGSGRRYISLVPAMAQRLIHDSAALAELAAYDAVVIGGQAIPESVTATLRKHQVRVVLSYGATETCGGCVYDGLPLSGVQMNITSSGQVQISGEVVMLGYRHDYEVSELSEIRGLRSFVMPDFGEIDAQGRLRILGRADDVVVVNGVNVSLTAVENVLTGVGIDAVVCASDMRVFAVTSAPVAMAKVAEATSLVQDALAVRLDFHAVAEIPTNASGKPDRQALLHHLAKGI